MNTRKIATEYRLSQWAKVVQQRIDSGKTIKDFCIDEGISRNTYFYWQKKLREAACKDLVTSEESGIVPNGWMRLQSNGSQYVFCNSKFPKLGVRTKTWTLKETGGSPYVFKRRENESD